MRRSLCASSYSYFLDAGCFPFIRLAVLLGVVTFILSVTATIFLSIDILAMSSSRLGFRLVLLGYFGGVLGIKFIIDGLASRRRLVGRGVGVGFRLLDLLRSIRD